MRTLQRLLILCLVLITGSAMGQGQLNSLVGRPAPDFELKDVDYYHKKNVRLADFKGKWLILDFWSKTCASCIAGFPKLNKLQTHFSDKVQFLLIGNNTRKYNTGIKQMFDKIRNYQQLDLPIAYDSVLFERFGISVLPHQVIIDPSGIIRASGLMGADLTTEYLQSLINGSSGTVKADPGDDGFLVSSKLSKWQKGTPVMITPKIDYDTINSRFSTTATSLAKLYNLAFFGEIRPDFSSVHYGEFWRLPILKLRDTSDFVSSIRHQKGLYNYETVVPRAKATRDYLQFALTCDLYKCFGYDVNVERRLMPCWNLVISDKSGADFRSKSDTTYSKMDWSGFELKKVSIHKVLSLIQSLQALTYPFFDETGIQYDVDVTVNADVTNFEQIKQALRGQGFDLVLGKRMTNVLIIREGKQQ